MEDPKAMEHVGEIIKSSIFLANDSTEDSTKDQETMGAATKEMMMAMLKYMPVRGALSFGDGKTSKDDLQKVIDKLNGEG